EAQTVEPVGGPEISALRGADVPRIAVPVAPACDTFAALSRCSCTAITWITLIALVPAIFCPLQNVAVHVVETPRVRLEGIHCNGLLPILTLRTTTLVEFNTAVVVGLLRRDR